MIVCVRASYSALSSRWMCEKRFYVFCFLFSCLQDTSSKIIKKIAVEYGLSSVSFPSRCKYFDACTTGEQTPNRAKNNKNVNPIKYFYIHGKKAPLIATIIIILCGNISAAAHLKFLRVQTMNLFQVKMNNAYNIYVHV